MYPAGDVSDTDRWMALLVFAIAGTEIALAACAYRFDIGATVRARAIVEPWAISIAAVGFWFVSMHDGLMLAYAAAMVAAFLTALWPMFRHYGGPGVWRPHPAHLIGLARRNAPLAAADAIEWGTRRLDLFILGQFTSPAIYGIYYMAQQVASLPQKLKTSFEPILGPVITRSLAEKRFAAVAAQVSQVGFWIIAAQAGVARALGIPGWRIFLRHVLPNAVTPVVTVLPFLLVSGISALTSLDFLGFGLQPPAPSWGELLRQGLDNLHAPWLAIAATMALFVTLLLATFVGEGLREAFDPKADGRVE